MFVQELILIQRLLRALSSQYSIISQKDGIKLVDNINYGRTCTPLYFIDITTCSIISVIYLNNSVTNEYVVIIL